MNFHKMLELHGALEACSASYTTMHEGKPVAVVPSFSGTTRLTLARMLQRLKPEVESFTATTQAIVKEAGGPWPKENQTLPACVAAKLKIAELGHQEASVDMTGFTLPEADFLSDNCRLPPAVIEVLLPFIQ